MDRRGFLSNVAITIASSAINGSTSIATEAQGSPPVACRTGSLLGVAVSNQTIADPIAAKAIVKHFGGLTCQSAMKSRVIFHDPSRYDFSEAEMAMRFAQRNDLRVRGHTLLWHLAMPAWLVARLEDGGAGAVLSRYVEDIPTHFRDRIYSWDVVNEPLSDSNNRSGSPLKRTVLTSKLGEEIIRDAFVISHEADPYSKKYLNDFFFLLDNERCRSKMRNALRYCERLRSAGVPIHGIGLQGHLNAETILPRRERVEFFTELKAMGLEVSITELDVRDRLRRRSLKDRDQAICDTVRDFVESFREVENRGAIFTWDLSDRYYSPAKTKKLNVGEQRPYPLDRYFRPKGLYDVLRDC